MNNKTLLLISCVIVAVALVLLSLSETAKNEPAACPIPSLLSTQSLQLAANPKVSDVVAANNAFAVDFLRATDDGKNRLFSPASMQVLFSLLYETANHDTAKQIQQSVGISPDMEARRSTVAYIASLLDDNDPDAMMESASSLWVADSIELDETYLDTVRNTYLADVKQIDSNYNAAKSIEQINDWIRNKTHETASEWLSSYDVDNSTLILLDAVYLDGIWRSEILENDTRRHTFQKNSNQTVDADFMRVIASFGYADLDGVQVLKIPYKGDKLSMLVILPDHAHCMSPLQENLTMEFIQKWHHGLEPTPITVILPKFELGTHYDLMYVLKNLKGSNAFDEMDADLLGYFDMQSDAEYAANRPHISKVFHDAYIQVDEGAEYSPDTGPRQIPVANWGWLTGWIPEPCRNNENTSTYTDEKACAIRTRANFIADRPFVFTIQDNESGMILLMGVMRDPTV